MPANVLAGPILRRTTKHRVCVWLATSEPLTLQLTLFDADNKTLGVGGMDAYHPKGIQLGKNIYVHLLQARPPQPSEYPFDTLIFYKIEVIQDGKTTDLFSKEELQQLVYGQYEHPNFFIPTSLNNMLHGSCRKPHSETASADAMYHGHVRMQQSYDDLKQRPAVLFLTGDQIYADDVVASLSAMLRDRAVELTGMSESLPQAGDPRHIPLQGRKHVLSNNKSGFTSGESYNHLFSFGEYAAMYVYVYGNVPQWDPVWAWDDLRNRGIAQDEEGKLADNLPKLNTALKKFHSTLADVRLLMANIPTYMIFDDHDVTDDWNITHSWYDNVRYSDLGRRIVSNALAAAWAFQCWGNDPDNFGKDMIISIQKWLNGPQDDKDIAERYDLQTWKHRGWGFSVPTFPPIIAIDSRTQRQYDDYDLPAQLMDRYAFDWLRVEWAKLVTDYSLKSDLWPVFIAATPVLGFTAIEGFQNKSLRLVKFVLSWFGKKIKALFFLPWFEKPIDRALVNIMDIESWSANKKGYKALFDTLQLRMKLPGCLFLSGDVHYAFTARGKFKCAGKQFESLQFTSSALHNMPGERNQALLENLGEELPSGWHGVFLSLVKRNRWTSTSNLLGSDNKHRPIYADANLGLVHFHNGVPISHTLLTDDDEWLFVVNPEPSGQNTVKT